MNILSLFDGISCGQIALNRCGIKYDNYFASEIDKHAIKVTQHNYPNTIQLGDITKWKEWNLPKIDLILAGSPCQGFSFAGKQLNFNDSRSGLFFEFVNILHFYKPEWFLLENVKMKKEYEIIINDQLNGISPILINSNCFCPQFRERLYWSNFEISKEYKYNDSYLSSVLINDVGLKYYLYNSYKVNTIKTNEPRLNILYNNYRYNHRKMWYKPVLVSEVVNDTPNKRSRQTDRLYSIHSKCPTLLANRSCDLKIDNGSDDYKKWRTLTPIECERLQTVPENYTSCISDNQRYKCLGNGWTVDVICHILKGIKND